MSILHHQCIKKSELSETTEIDINDIPQKYKNVKLKVIFSIESDDDLINTLHCISFFMVKTIPKEVAEYIENNPNTRKTVKNKFPNLFKDKLNDIYFYPFIKKELKMDPNGKIAGRFTFTSHIPIPRNFEPYSHLFFNYGIVTKNINKLLFHNYKEDNKYPDIRADNFALSDLYDDVTLSMKNKELLTSNDNKSIAKKDICNIYIGGNILKIHNKASNNFAIFITKRTMESLKKLYNNLFKLQEENRLYFDRNRIQTIDGCYCSISFERL